MEKQKAIWRNKKQLGETKSNKQSGRCLLFLFLNEKEAWKIKQDQKLVLSCTLDTFAIYIVDIVDIVYIFDIVDIIDIVDIVDIVDIIDIVDIVNIVHTIY